MTIRGPCRTSKSGFVHSAGLTTRCFDLASWSGGGRSQRWYPRSERLDAFQPSAGVEGEQEPLTVPVDLERVGRGKKLLDGLPRTGPVSRKARGPVATTDERQAG